MNVAKNWAHTIIAIALAFAHFSANCWLKKQIIIPVKKMLNNAGHIDAKIESILAKFAKKIRRNWLFFTDCFLAKFPTKAADFSKNPSKFEFILLKSREISRFFHDFPAIVPPKIPQNFDFFSTKYQKPWQIAPAWADKEVINIIFSYDGHCTWALYIVKHCLEISIPSIMFLGGFHLYSERVILQEFLFPLSSKTNLSKYKFDLDWLMHINHFVELCYFFILLFVYFMLFIQSASCK